MRILPRPLQAGAVAALGLAMVAATSGLSGAPASASPGPRFAALKNSVSATTDHRLGAYTSSRMSVEVSLAPRNQAGLASELHAAYSQGSRGYHQWLRAGQFDATYAPSAAQRSAVTGYLRGQGLRVGRSASPFLVTASGSSRQLQAAFHTSLSTYRNSRGTEYFANSTAVELPTAIAGSVLGVIGLTNTVREHSGAVRVTGAASGHSSTSCETPYVTKKELFKAVNKGVSFPYGYGGGPGCSGLTPDQINSTYGSPHVGARGKGSGVTAAVFELSAFLRSDISTWTNQFYGASYQPPLGSRLVDGGPLHPQCPPGDKCPRSIEGYTGTAEVDADIEMELAVAPDLHKLMVYNAPNDFTGQTELDEYTAMAQDDTADTVSSSWSICENDAPVAYLQSENLVFEQMALQGQSVFVDNQDTGAFGCIRSDGTDIPNVQDPSSQPWVTSVGGTSLESDNPGTRSHPGYPQGVETVWNTDNLCSDHSATAASGDQTGYFWCGATGAAGGGPSQWWGRPFYQYGPGVNSKDSTVGNGTTQCALAKVGTPCRETPDVSANADPYTGYAEYCTGNAHTPRSECNFSSAEAVPGWFAIGGCSLSTPLWAAMISDRDSYTGHRIGNINPLVYSLFNAEPGAYFHDVTGIGAAQKAATNNGLFPTTPGYDMATGIGTPDMAALITRSGP
ncbi:MAG TPA: S53 family peptidase [Streptosporangiaceae bacterium]|jgi:kumamolisin|nr:S53 family peptidase [Streptosporangiaceae bacterium]